MGLELHRGILILAEWTGKMDWYPAIHFGIFRSRLEYETAHAIFPHRRSYGRQQCWAWHWQGRKNADDDTQTLELPKDPPMVAIGETSHLIFNVSPLSAKGLLSQQTREALQKPILKAKRRRADCSYSCVCCG